MLLGLLRFTELMSGHASGGTTIGVPGGGVASPATVAPGEGAVVDVVVVLPSFRGGAVVEVVAGPGSSWGAVVEVLAGGSVVVVAGPGSAEVCADAVNAAAIRAMAPAMETTRT
ncbi:MAG: hypothetical protein JO087_13490 [Actinobacteria bacterium]|nr:hypothetical protein [Actinomycetota bacterium]